MFPRNLAVFLVRRTRTPPGRSHDGAAKLAAGDKAPAGGTSLAEIDFGVDG